MVLSRPATMLQAKPYQWPHDSSFGPSTTALIIVDMQKDFLCPGGYLDSQGLSVEPTRAVIPQVQRLLAAFRTSGFPIYHTREGHRPDLSTLSSRELLRSRNNPSGRGIGDEGPLGRHLVRGEQGHDIIPELAPLPSEPVIDKPGRSAFQHTDLKLLLDNRRVRNLVICGVTTDVCVTSTMRDGSKFLSTRLCPPSTSGRANIKEQMTWDLIACWSRTPQLLGIRSCMTQLCKASAKKVAFLALCQRQTMSLLPWKPGQNEFDVP